MRRPAATLILTYAATLLASTPPPVGALIHVAKSGNDSNTGQDWQTAKLTVQAGLAAATSGDQIWVAACFGQAIRPTDDAGPRLSGNPVADGRAARRIEE